MHFALIFLALTTSVSLTAGHADEPTRPPMASEEDLKAEKAQQARLQAKIADPKELKRIVPLLLVEYTKTGQALADYLKKVESETVFEKEYRDYLRGEIEQIMKVKLRLAKIVGKLNRGEEVALSLWLEDRDLARLDNARFMLAFFPEYLRVRQKKVKSDDPAYAEKEGYLALMKNKAAMANLQKERLFKLSDRGVTYTNTITGKSETRPVAIRRGTKDGFLSAQWAFVDQYAEYQELIASGKITKEELSEDDLKENFVQHFVELTEGIKEVGD